MSLQELCKSEVVRTAAVLGLVLLHICLPDSCLRPSAATVITLVMVQIFSAFGGLAAPHSKGGRPELKLQQELRVIVEKVRRTADTFSARDLAQSALAGLVVIMVLARTQYSPRERRSPLETAFLCTALGGAVSFIVKSLSAEVDATECSSGGHETKGTDNAWEQEDMRNPYDASFWNFETVGEDAQPQEATLLNELDFE